MSTTEGATASLRPLERAAPLLRPLQAQRAITFALSVLLAATLGGDFTHDPRLWPGTPSLASHWLGVGSIGNSPPKLDAFFRLTGLHPTVSQWGIYWPNPLPSAPMDAAYARGTMPLLTWQPWSNGYGSAGLTDAQVLSGAYDPYLRAFAQQARAWGHPFLLRFAQEMNGDWFSYGVAAGHNGNSPATFVAAWRHVHDLFVQAGATNVRWVWCPAALTSSDPAAAQLLSALYPGDAYVDWIGYDGYNFGGVHWASFHDVYQPTYNAITHLAGSANTKPLLIAEGAAPDGPQAPSASAKAAWITSGLLVDLPTTMPRIRGYCWFQADTTADGGLGGQDWRVNTSPQALAAFRAVAASSFWQAAP